MDNLKKLSKDELKQIFGGKGDPPGGNNNPPTGGNGGDNCGVEPSVCSSPEWITWKNCKAINNTTPSTFTCY